MRREPKLRVDDDIHPRLRVATPYPVKALPFEASANVSMILEGPFGCQSSSSYAAG